MYVYMLQSYFRILREKKTHGNKQWNYQSSALNMKHGKVLQSFSLIGSVILQCWTKCEEGGAPKCLMVMVEVIKPLLVPFWQSCSRLHTADLEILSGRNAAAMFV